MSTVFVSSYPTDLLFGQQEAKGIHNFKDEALKTRVKRQMMNIIYDAQESEQSSSQSVFPTYTHPSSYPGHMTYPPPPPSMFIPQPPTSSYPPPLLHSTPDEPSQPQNFTRSLDV